MADIGHVYKTKFPRKLRQFNRNAQLPSYFAELIGDKKQVRIAEVGAGPINTIGDSWPSVEVEVVPSDVLAHEYDAELWVPSGATPVLPVQFADMECLPYDDESFDIVHCVNALDHTPDIEAALDELKRICKVGGVVYLRHSHDQKRRFGGHHHWNAQLVKGVARFQNENDILLLDEFTSYEIMGDRDPLIVSIWKKT
jgi:SAM-dependent methyltransferase